MFIGACLMALVAGAHASNWRWPDEAHAASLRIDTKVRFVDDDSRRPNKVQADEIKPPVETEGFYNRPEGAESGRYAVQSAPQRLTRPRYSDGTLDSLQYCKCVENPGPACHTPNNLPKACSPGMHLCCYKRPNRTPKQGIQSDFFSELDDERPMLLPNYEKRTGPFESSHEEQFLVGSHNTPSYQHSHRILVGPPGPTGSIGPNQHGPGVLVGPDGPTGVIGPNRRDNRLVDGTNQRNPGILVGPDGPTGVVGPNNGILTGPDQRNPGVLVGPSGPTGIIGPVDHDSGKLTGPHGTRKHNLGVLVGPGGPTGVIGPHHRDDRGPTGFLRPNQQNPGILTGPEGPSGNIGPGDSNPWVLVGPGGPTGGYGPDPHKQGVHSSNQGAESAQVLVGPSGPTGLIGPGGRRGRWQGPGLQAGPGGPGLLVGPGGPTGIIGPGQRLLVGPGGPTGRLGPRGYGQYGF